MSNQTAIHVGLTGHRPKKLGGYRINTPAYLRLQQDLELYITYQLQRYDIVVGHSGLALGADTIWSKAILAMRERYPDRVQFHAEIPMMEQPSKWFAKSDIDFWHKQIDEADFKSVYGDLSGCKNDKERRRLATMLLNKRNEGMLDHSDILLAVWDGTSGGTGNAVKYARKTGLEVVRIDPTKYFS